MLIDIYIMQALKIGIKLNSKQRYDPGQMMDGLHWIVIHFIFLIFLF